MPDPFQPSTLTIKTQTGNIPYKILMPPGQNDWVKGRSGDDGQSVTVRVETPWKTRHLFEGYMLGYSAPGGSHGIARTLPEQLGFRDDTLAPGPPDDQPARVKMWCAQLDLVGGYGNGVELTDPDYVAAYKKFTNTVPPFSKWNNWPNPLTAQYDATFAAPWKGVLPELMLPDTTVIPGEWRRFVVIKRKPAAENEQVSHGRIGYLQGANFVSIGQQSFRRGSIARYEIKWLHVPSVPWANLEAASGRVNNAAFALSPTEEIAKHKFLFDTFEVEEFVNARRETVYNLTYHYIRRLDGRTWNLFDNGSGTGFLPLKRAVNNVVVADAFLEADFASLFQV